jgi:hypothetical protein
MCNDDFIQEMVEGLEQNGEIRLTDGIKEVCIRSLDEDSDLIYVSDSNREFDDAESAIIWAVDQFGGIENVEEWE